MHSIIYRSYHRIGNNNHVRFYNVLSLIQYLPWITAHYTALKSRTCTSLLDSPHCYQRRTSTSLPPDNQFRTKLNLLVRRGRCLSVVDFLPREFFLCNQQALKAENIAYQQFSAKQKLAWYQSQSVHVTWQFCLTLLLSYLLCLASCVWTWALGKKGLTVSIIHPIILKFPYSWKTTAQPNELSQAQGLAHLGLAHPPVGTFSYGSRLVKYYVYYLLWCLLLFYKICTGLSSAGTLSDL